MAPSPAYAAHAKAPFQQLPEDALIGQRVSGLANGYVDGHAGSRRSRKSAKIEHKDVLLGDMCVVSLSESQDVMRGERTRTDSNEKHQNLTGAHESERSSLSLPFLHLLRDPPLSTHPASAQRETSGNSAE
ncbi:hypothetical protein V8C42DRAFT_339893 [Trichoderma barbatum]